MTKGEGRAFDLLSKKPCDDNVVVAIEGKWQWSATMHIEISTNEGNGHTFGSIAIQTKIFIIKKRK